MSDALWAAREGDALMHTSMLADIVGGVLEVAATVAIGALATAAVGAALGITAATGGLGCFVLGAVVGVVVGVAMASTGADTALSRFCEGIGNALFPPSIQANIATGSHDTHTNGKPAARAAGVVLPPPPADASLAEEEPEEETFLDMAQGFFSQLWRPTVASPAPNTAPADDDKVICSKHPAMPPQYIAEGSSKVSINGQPAARSGDRSTCEGVIVDSGLISSDVRIGGEPIVVREIRSGKTPGVGLAVTALMMLRGRGGKFYSKLGCMLVGGATSFVSGQVTGALTRAITGSPNPVHAATGAKVLGGEDEQDFRLAALIPLEWQRFYSSRDERRDGLFGAGWSVSYEVFVRIEADPEGGERLLYTDEQARVIDMGHIPPGDAVFSPGEGLSVRRALNGELLIEDIEGLYRLFEPSPEKPAHLRLSQLGDRNDNRLYLHYDERGRLSGLRDTFDLVRIQLHYSPQWPSRVSTIERVHDDGSLETLASYRYDEQGDLCEVLDEKGRLRRRFAYDDHRHMIEHQTASGLRCYYEWQDIEGERRVSRHWTCAGDEYCFNYDISAGLTRITDNLQRVSIRRWNAQYQITEYIDAMAQAWCFEWNDERQLLAATDPQGGRWQYFYDESGNLSQTIDPLGRSESTQWLEHWALPRTHLDPMGNRWHYHYDQRGNCVRECDPQGNVTRYRYDVHGQVVAVTNAAGQSTTRRWNRLGLLVEEVDCSGFPTRYAYDHRGHLSQVIDAESRTTRYTHDARGWLLCLERPDGNREQYQRSTEGLLLAHANAAGHVTRYEYNRRGQVSRQVDAAGRQVGFEYDAQGRLVRLRNENGESYRFSWDADDRLVEQRDLDDTCKQYTYDSLGNLVRLVFHPEPGSPEVPIVHTLERDAAGRLVAKITSDGRTDYHYDALDQLTSVESTSPDGIRQTLDFTYDRLGQLLQERTARGSLSYSYDELGNLTGIRLGDGRQLNRLMYGSGHLHQLNLNGHVIADFERDRLHREVTRTQGRLLCRSEYDPVGRLRSRGSHAADQTINPLSVARQHFAYDGGNNLVEVQALKAQGNTLESLGYDATGRILVRHDPLAGQYEHFHYDAAANLLDRSGKPPIRHNRLLCYQDKHYRYDGFGRLVEKRSNRRGIQRFRYDAEHRLIEVRNLCAGRETVVSMHYDPLGRRIAKEERTPQGLLVGRTEFTWDGLRLLEERRNGRSSLYVYTDAGHEPLARIDSAGAHQQVLHFHNHLNGLPLRLTSEDGDTRWETRYEVWGTSIGEWRAPGHDEEQNLRFQGQYLDRETGLHYNTFRFYDPDIGRFTQPDPLGLAGGWNLYLYSPNPLGWIDPLGLTAGCPKLARRNRHHSRSATYTKHTQAKTQSQAQSLSSRGGAAQYWGKDLPENATAKQVTAFRNQVEKDALRHGTEIDLGNKGSSYYIHDAGKPIGFNNGKPTQYVRVEVTDTPMPEFHGHPISQADYMTYLKSQK
ncbi:DUF6531 domain-containing protein [Pseudomonas guariconensis]|uniref:RHS repeat-associated core domain-containing protein n=1 Tax=Pseudomonas TaxID=286 RepID=UPI0020968432|nr:MULTISPECIES: RHS repeat-associated core domain-containing protein [Pseudomonas]MCO7514372.1 DUF6531 domain-containing protein [Pseudomonas putida]MCO7604425.1 DUF6531 domain-containing protein [Pseudomonas guariconensis]